MATLILRPSSDIELKHDKSGGSNGYALINESTADGDSTYISGKNSGNSYTSHTSKFLVSGTIPSGAIRITGVSATINAKHDGDSANNGYAKVNAQITMQNGSGLSQKSSEQNVNTNYANYTFTFSPSTLGVANKDFVSLDNLFSLEVITNSKPKSTSYKNYNVRVTQAYITITYETSTIPTYTCSAIASTNTSNATVSPTTVLSGGTATFSASVNEDCVFDGWYNGNGDRVSRDNPYTATITAHTTLYSRANAIMYQSRVGAQPQYGSASVSPASGAYGSSVTFTCTVTDSSKMFWGWFTEPEHINCVSTLPTYTTTHPRSDFVLYPYIGDPLYTTIIKCSHVYDVKPFRFNGSGTYNNGNNGPSTSLVTNADVLKTNSIGSSTYAVQPHPKYEKDFNFAMAFHFAEGVDALPDNATIVGVEGHIGLATMAGSQYYNMSLFAGEIKHIDYHNTAVAQPDETCVTTTRGSARSLSVTASPTDYSLSMPQMGTWTPNEIKNGRCGIQLDFMHSGDQSQLHIYDAEIHVKYTYTQTTYTCNAVSDGNCDVYVMDANNPIYNRYDSDLKVTAGQSATWHARPKPGYRFDGWYSDAAKTQWVSSDASYTTSVNTGRTLYAKTHYHSRVISKTLAVPYGQGATYYDGYYLNGSTLTKTNSGSNGYQADLNLSTLGVTGLSTKASIASTNGKEYIYAYLNSAAMDLLFPNATAHPVSMDWHDEAGRGSATILLNLVARNPMTPNETVSPIIDNTILDYQRPSLIEGVPTTQTDLRDDCVLNMTKSSKLGYMFHMTNASASKAIGVNSSTFTLYFEEYDFAAQIHQSAKGIEAVAVSRAIGYEGDSVTFTATLLPGVTFDGWYDGNGTKVSSDVTYTCVPDANLTLYAKASTTLNVYSVSATADAHVASVNCDHIIMTDGNPVVFTAIVNEPGWEFDGWYFNGTKLSSDNTYSYIINTDTTLVAKAKQLNYTITVEQGAGGTATATPSSGTYNTESILEWEDALGWYDFEKWQIAGFVRPALTEATIYVDQAIDVGNWGPFAAPEEYYNIGDYHWNNAKYVYPTGLNECDVIWDDELFMNVPISDCSYTRYNAAGRLVATYVKVIGGKEHGYPFGFYSAQDSSRELIVATDNKINHEFGLFIANRIPSITYTDLSTNNPYTHLIVDNVSVRAVASEKPWYHCAVEGEHTNLVSISATQGHVIAGTSVTFSYNGGSSYEFFGWYTDAECTQLITEDTSYTFTPNEDVIIYAKIQQTAASTGVYIRQNGGYIVAKAVYKKVNGVYVEQTDPQSVFDSTKHYKTIIT